MLQFSGENFDIYEDPILNDNEKLYILITHDKTLFYANDSQKSEQSPESEQLLCKKGQDHVTHVSKFLCETIGWLKLNDE